MSAAVATPNQPTTYSPEEIKKIEQSAWEAIQTQERNPCKLESLVNQLGEIANQVGGGTEVSVWLEWRSILDERYRQFSTPWARELLSS